MALIVFGGGVTNMVGSHAGNTFSKNKGGSYIKKKPNGTNPRTITQVANRSLLASLSKEFTFVLSDAQRAAWRTFAATYPVVNKLGNTTFLSAQQMYTKLNLPATVFGGGSSLNPPVSTTVNTPTSLSIAAVSGGLGYVNITAGATGLTADECVIVFASPPLNPGKNYVSSALRQLAYGIPFLGTYDATAQYLQNFGTLPSAGGQRIFCRAYILNMTNGISSTAIQASAIWS